MLICGSCRGSIWRPPWPSKLRDLLLEAEAVQRGFFIRTLIQTVQSMTTYYCRRPGPFFPVRDGVLMKAPYVSQDALHEGRHRPRRSTLAVIDNSSFYQATILHVSAIKSLLTHLVEFLPGIL
jgi:hypothetical protein